MKRFLAGTTLALFITAAPATAISRHPTGVNVNAQGATSVFITFGALNDQVPVEATWCGEVIPATPDIGFKCAPNTIFGQLPIRYDQSTLSGIDGFTDIMSIPPSVARRAYQAAQRGENSAFFYVRRFVSLSGGPDEYVFVTCRMTGGGARVPLALLDVQLVFDVEKTVVSVEREGEPPTFLADITYNGTGRLQGRWEVVIPGDEPPDSRDLLPEASLPAEERPLQKRYTLIERFNVFLAPTGRYRLEGPDPSRFPTRVDGLYQILLRIEATADKEGDSNLGAAGAGNGIVSTGGVAGFPMPVLRYFVGTASDLDSVLASDELEALLPEAGATVASGAPIDFAWSQVRAAGLYRVEIAASGTEEASFTALLQQGIGSYRAPSFVWDRVGGGTMQWRVVALGPDGKDLAVTDWRELLRAAG